MEQRKLEEAIKGIKEDQCHQCMNYAGGVCKSVVDCPYKVAIECIEKQIPMKPKYAHHCPSCELGLPAKGFSAEYCGCCFKWNFCLFCGQAILWEEEGDGNE